MPDQKPPQLDLGERPTLLALLQYQRSSLVRKVAGVDEESARRSLVGSGTTLLWLLKHMTRAENTWIVHRFAGVQDSIPEDVVHANDTVELAIAAYKETWVRVDSIVAAAPGLDERCRLIGDEHPVNLRWVVMHLLEETARHAGHADILRELVDGRTGR